MQSGVEFAHPIFGVFPVKYGYKLYDKYNAQQSHVKRIIGTFNSATVWDFAGVDDTIVVAVVDDGTTTHEDLPGTRVLPGRDYATYYDSVYDNNPSPGGDQAHGMGCAGLIAASHTTDSTMGLQSSSGMISMKPQIKIRPVKIFSDQGSSVLVGIDKLAAAISYAWQSGAAVLSCSWGFGPKAPPQGYDAINRAIDRAWLDGRDGKGTIMVFAAGNEANDTVAYPARKSNVLAVGALTASNQRWGYSNYGTALDVMAPSGGLCLQGDVWTLDQMSTLGYNPSVDEPCGESVTWSCADPNDTDYDCRFGGTSAACPLAAGAATLVLAKDPNLTASEVHNILRQSAVPLGTGWPNNEYGYGRVDAFRAVLSISHGDIDNNGFIADLGDLSALVAWLGQPHTPPFPSVKLADWNCDGVVDLGDLSAIVAYLGGCTTCGPVKPCFRF